MANNAIKTRLYHEDLLTDAAEVVLSASQAHFLGNVLRLKTEDEIALFNRRDGEWVGSISALKKKMVTVELRKQTREGRSELGPWLVFAPLKKVRTQFVIEKATELGVERLMPVITANTIGGRINTDRMWAQAMEAAEQCERLTVPTIEDPQSIDELLNTWPQNRSLLVGDETGGGVPIADLISSKVKNSFDCGILIGPEGGFKSFELEQLKGADFCCFMDLGPRILRAETAAIAALACIQALT